MKLFLLSSVLRASLLSILFVCSGCGPVAIAAAAFLLTRSDGNGSSSSGSPVHVTLQGTIRFQKRLVNLDQTAVTEMRPVRRGRVEILKINGGEKKVLAAVDADDSGFYSAAFDTKSGAVLRVSALAEILDSRSSMVVRDSLDQKEIYSWESDKIHLTKEAEQTQVLDLDIPIDCDAQVAGAFNILDSALVGFMAIDGIFSPLDRPLTLFWELGDADGTYFSISSKDITGDAVGDDPYIHISGGPSADLPDCWNSDQFDDGFILHEFGHFVVYYHSRDDSPGGPHSFREKVDPRLAWSEGWASFFTCLAQTLDRARENMSPAEDPWLFDTYEDKKNCTWPCRIDAFTLDKKVGEGCSCCRGIGSEEAIGELLWDFFDSKDDDDSLEIPLVTIFQSLQGLKEDHFVYVGDFIRRTIDQVQGSSPEKAAEIMDLAEKLEMAAGSPLQLIPFPDPFESVVQSGNGVSASVSGSVDGCLGLSCGVNVENYIGSSDFYELLIPGSPGLGGTLTARLSIDPSTGSCSNDLNLRMYNQSQSVILVTDGTSQRPPEKRIEISFDQNFQRGTYMLFEVAGDVPDSFNYGQSASYELTVVVQ